MRVGDWVGVWSGRWACKSEGCRVTGARDPGEHNGMMTGFASVFAGASMLLRRLQTIGVSSEKALTFRRAHDSLGTSTARCCLSRLTQ